MADLGGNSGSHPAGQAPSGLVAPRVDPGRDEIDCPFNPETQLAEYLAWLAGFKAGVTKATGIWRSALSTGVSA